MTLSQLEITGAEVYAATVGNELTRRGHHITYISDTLGYPVRGKYIQLTFNNRRWLCRLWHIIKLVYIIRRYQIQLVHAHSRAAGWSSYIACKLTGTPMLTTVHGRQPVHASRKAFHAFGYKAIAICEDIRTQIISALEVPPEDVVVIPNGIEIAKFTPRQTRIIGKPRVSIIGRLTGPKGDVCYRLLDEVLADLILQNRIEVNITSGSIIPKRFKQFENKIHFQNPTADVSEVIAQSHLVIGAGRVAIEALLMNRPVFAIGEAYAIGMITIHNLNLGIRNNFGDVGPRELDINFKTVRTEIETILEKYGQLTADQNTGAQVRQQVASVYDVSVVVDKLEKIYQDAFVETKKREIPILMYHRFIEQESEKGIHGTWVTTRMFEKHLALIKHLGFETITFKDLHEKGFVSRLSPNKKFLIITADDGYKDNLTRMLPLLHKYGMKAVVYVVTNETHNRWDTDHPTAPDTKVELLSQDEIRVLAASGHIEIGGHTSTHAKLDELNPLEQRREIRENKARLEEILGHPIISFAYPYGNINESAKSEVQSAGYFFAVATDSGPRVMHKDSFQLRRIAVFPRTNTFGLWRKIRGNYAWKR
jgi:peptidoglycan/xylan/chitin deacetylase (PgdA/CDA1 family)/glycosyltransferase involved in cell wall biosynthesis